MDGEAVYGRGKVGRTIEGWTKDVVPKKDSVGAYLSSTHIYRF